MVDYNKPPKELLLDLIYFSNGIRFEPDEVDFGIPQFLDQRPDIDWDPNSYIPIEVPDKVDARYVGRTGFMYRRMYLRDIVPVQTGPIPVPSYPTDTLTLLPVINAYYGTQITAEDIVNQQYETAASPLLIVFQETSLCWIGDGVAGENSDSNLVPQPFLTGFKEFRSVA